MCPAAINVPDNLMIFLNLLLPAVADALPSARAGGYPVLQHDVEFECKSCGTLNTSTLKGLQSFFW